jgi:hypothetical protein
MTTFAKVARNVRRAFRREAVQPPAPEPLETRPKPMVGFFALLNKEQKEQALKFSGQHDFGEENNGLGRKYCA